MEPHELNRMFDHLSPTPEQEEAILSRLLTERKRSPMKKIKKLTAVLAAAALMVCAAAAAVATGIDRRLLESFGGAPEDLALISPTAVEVNEIHTYESGWTVKISQVLADRLALAVLVDITAPAGTVLSQEERLSLSISQLDEQGERITSGHALLGFIRQLEDGDPADNHMTVLWQVRKTQGEESVPYTGSTVKIIPGSVIFREGDQMVPHWFQDRTEDADESTWWSCTVQLPDADPGITCDMDRPLSIGTAQVRLAGIYLSPLSLTVYMEDEAQMLRAPEGETPEEWEEYWATMALEWEDNVLLTMADGTQLAASSSQGKVAGMSYSFLFDQILNPEEVSSITLFGQTFSLN